ncbi:MAG: deoxyribose-phosphate aldolase [Oscillospiraceae bacterium]|nr:deoxyribose-phosphate aldolase [Oscillospiraceae bacterium]
MDNSTIFSHVDHTLLTMTATQADIERLCGEAVTYKTACVCIPPCYIKHVRSLFPSLNICSVIGFPLGYDSIYTKSAAVQIALGDGADELDMVINLADVKNGEFDKVREEIYTLKQLVGVKILKVIVETCYLTQAEKIALCQVVTDSGADYIKTSTGFGTGGATLDDIKLFKANVGQGVKIKAAGGIRIREDMIAFLDHGAKRLGTSSAVKILCTETAKGAGY